MARTKKRAAAESEHPGTQSAQEFLSSNYTERWGPGVLILHIPVAQDHCRCGRSPVTPTRICLFPHVFNSHILCHTFSGFFSHRLSSMFGILIDVVVMEAYTCCFLQVKMEAYTQVLGILFIMLVVGLWLVDN